MHYRSSERSAVSGLWRNRSGSSRAQPATTAGGRGRPTSGTRRTCVSNPWCAPPVGESPARGRRHSGCDRCKARSGPHSCCNCADRQTGCPAPVPYPFFHSRASSDQGHPGLDRQRDVTTRFPRPVSRLDLFETGPGTADARRPASCGTKPGPKRHQRKTPTPRLSPYSRSSLSRTPSSTRPGDESATSGT